VVEIKDKELNPDSESDAKNNGKIQIIDTNPNSTVMTTTIKLEEPGDPKEWECLFHSQMWVKGTRCILLLIVEAKPTSSQQRLLIS
jgi:hypothetical protein